MKTLKAAIEQRAQMRRRLGASLMSVLLVLAFVLLAKVGAFARVSAGAKQTHALVVWYVRSGQWRADAATYATHVEYLLFPTSGAGARLDLEMDE